MQTQKRLMADLLFGVQILFGMIFGSTQFIHMLETARGVNMSWLILWEAFLAINFVLAIRSHAVQPSRVTAQTIVSYSLWSVVIGANIVVMLSKHDVHWSAVDTSTTLLVTLGVIATLTIARFNHVPFGDPVVRGVSALFFKAVPQLMLAYNIHLIGGAGLSGIAILAGHLTILTRLGQLWFSIKEAGWDRNRLGSAVSEIGNEASWLITTLVWLYWWLHHLN